MFIILWLLFILLIFGGGLFGLFILLRKLLSKRKPQLANQKAIFDKNDALSQLFYVLALGFLLSTFLGLNQKMGTFLDWPLIILLISIIGLAMAYRIRLLFTLIFSLVCLVFGLIAQDVIWLDDINMDGSFLIMAQLVLLGTIAFLLGRAQSGQVKLTRFANCFLISGIFLMTGSMFFLTSQWGLNSLEDYAASAPIGDSWQLATTGVALVLASGLSLSYAYNKKLINYTELIMSGIIIFFMAFLIFLPPMDIYVHEGYEIDTFNASGIIWSLWLNLLMFGLVFGWVSVGYQRKESWMINLGAFFLVVYIVIKYFDWFFTFLDKSVFFISAGILLFLVGYFMEKGRRYMLETINPK